MLDSCWTGDTCRDKAEASASIKLSPINQLSRAEWMGSGQVCHKCAVHCDPMCAKALLFNTRADCFRAGLIVGKLLMFNDAKTWKTPSDPPTLNQ